MPVRDTSAAAFKRGEALDLTIDYLIENAPCTRREIAEGTEITPSTMAGIINPLIKMGIVFEVRKRPCKVTGYKSMELILQREFKEVAACIP